MKKEELDERKRVAVKKTRVLETRRLRSARERLFLGRDSGLNVKDVSYGETRRKTTQKLDLEGRDSP